MAKTADGLLQYARSKIGTPYVYGAKMQMLTQAMFKSLQAAYGKSMVWDSDAGKIGKVCCDCSGLISSYTGIARSSAGYKDAAAKVNPIATIKDAPLGALVWMQGHIGIYSGLKNNVPYYVAEDGSAYGCRETALSNNHFTSWFLCADVDYNTPKPAAKPTANNAAASAAKPAMKPEEDLEMRYHTINEMPDWAKPTVQKLISKKYLSGDEKGLDLSEDMLRLLVINDRAGAYQ